jgi:hypothetical protein
MELDRERKACYKTAIPRQLKRAHPVKWPPPFIGPSRFSTFLAQRIFRSLFANPLKSLPLRRRKEKPAHKWTRVNEHHKEFAQFGKGSAPPLKTYRLDLSRTSKVCLQGQSRCTDANERQQ